LYLFAFLAFAAYFKYVIFDLVITRFTVIDGKNTGGLVDKCFIRETNFGKKCILHETILFKTTAWHKIWLTNVLVFVIFVNR